MNKALYNMMYGMYGKWETWDLWETWDRECNKDGSLRRNGW